MRSLAAQSRTELGGTWSVLTRQKTDHVALDAMLHEVSDAAPPEQREVLHRIYRLVFPHAFAEESVLWPVMRRVLPDGEELTLRVEEEHQQINQLVAELERTSPFDPGRPALIARLVELLREDVRDEEDLLLPRLQERLTLGQLRWLGVAWTAVRRTAPTRTHPVVSRRPPGNVLAALPLSILDRCRDALERAATSRDQFLWPLARLDDALGRAAAAVEQYAVSRTGERPETAAAPAR